MLSMLIYAVWMGVSEAVPVSPLRVLSSLLKRELTTTRFSLCISLFGLMAEIICSGQVWEQDRPQLCFGGCFTCYHSVL